jgi:oligoendopeptidase F
MTAGTAEGVRWDLTPLAPSGQAMRDRLEAALADASAFVERWPAAVVGEIDAPRLADLLPELASLRATRREGDQWVFLLEWSDAENPAVADVGAWVRSRLPALDDAIRHFELAWIGVPDGRARELAADEALARDRHYLLGVRRFAPFVLSPAEERVLSAREESANTAWRSLRDRTLGALVARFDDGTGEREWSLSELESARRSHAEREVRRRATQTTVELLDPVLPILAQSYDAVVADRLAVDRLRGHADPMAERNLQNEIDGTVVESLLRAAEAHRPLAHRWFATKARLLGLERLDTIDLQAAAVEAPRLSWSDGRRLAVEMFTSLSPALGGEAAAFFDERRIDAETRRGKPWGAFCIWPSTRVPGFVLVNWSDELRDLVDLTHELGHGTHYALAAATQTDNSLEPGLTLAEIPSTFAELRLVDHLLETDAMLGRAALARTVDHAVAVAFVASAMARYEQRAYAARADGGALTAERLCELCDAEFAGVWADAVGDEQGMGRRTWATLPHPVHERFYTYAYTFAFLLAAGLLRRSHEAGFAERYERFLASGGSGPPAELLGGLGVDLDDPGIWDDGFAMLEDWIETLDEAPPSG